MGDRQIENNLNILLNNSVTSKLIWLLYAHRVSTKSVVCDFADFYTEVLSIDCVKGASLIRRST